MADLTDLATVKTYMGITGAASDALLNLLIPAVSAQIERYCDRVFALTTYKERVWSDGGRVLYLPQYPVAELRRIMTDTKRAMTVKNTSTDALSATMQVSQEQDKVYLNVIGGASAGNLNVAIGGNTLAQLKAAIEALGVNWAVTVLSGCDDYPGAELLPFTGADALSPAYGECLVLAEPMDDLDVHPDSGRVECTGGNFAANKYIWIEWTGGYAAIPADLELLATRAVADVARQSTRDLTLKSEKLGDYAWTAADIAVNVAAVVDRYASELIRWKRFVLG